MTPIKTVRIPQDLREAIRAAAKRDNTNESAVIRRALRIYLKPEPQPKEKTQ